LLHLVNGNSYTKRINISHKTGLPGKYPTPVQLKICPTGATVSVHSVVGLAVQTAPALMSTTQYGVATLSVAHSLMNVPTLVTHTDRAVQLAQLVGWLQRVDTPSLNGSNCPAAADSAH
jgi:hypothetical protein